MLATLRMIWSHRRSLSEVTRAVDDTRKLLVAVAYLEFSKRKAKAAAAKAGI